MGEAAESQGSGQSSRGTILVLVSSNQRRGAEVFGGQLADGLHRAGWSAPFMALRDSGSESTVKAEPLPGIGSSPTSGLRPGVARSLRKVISEIDPAVVFAGGGATLKYSVMALLGRRSTPLVYSSIGEPEYWARNTGSRLMMTALLRRVDLITAVSGATRDQLVRSFGVPEDKVHVAHPGVPESFLMIQRTSHSGPLRVLFLGSLSDEKDPRTAVRAVGGMSSEAVLRLVGGGPLLESLRAADFPHVEVIGPTSDVRPHLEWADVLLLTSRTEGLPGVALEAGAAGIPVVTVDVGGVRDVVEDRVNGLVLERDDTAGISEALDMLADDPQLRSRLGDAAREEVRGHFLMDQAVARYVAILESLVRG